MSKVPSDDEMKARLRALTNQKSEAEDKVWIDAYAMAGGLTIDEVFTLAVGGIEAIDNNERKFDDARLGKAQELSKVCYKEMADKMHRGGLNTAQSVMVFHHMLLFAVAQILKKGMTHDPEGFHKLITKIKMNSAVKQIETLVEKKKEQSQ